MNRPCLRIRPALRPIARRWSPIRWRVLFWLATWPRLRARETDAERHDFPWQAARLGVFIPESLRARMRLRWLRWRD